MDIKRVPITTLRKPIIESVKISNTKISLCDMNTALKAKKSINTVLDCAGNEFVYVNKFTNISKRVISKYIETTENSPYFYINVGYINNLDFIRWVVENLASKNIPVYIETDRDLPENILSILSSNAFNAIQCNLTQISNQKEDYISEEEYKRIKELRQLPYKAKMNGLYVILGIGPIIPGVTQLKNILTMLTAEKKSYNHITINFIKIKRVLNAKEYVIFKLNSKETIRLDADYFELNSNNVWECARWYKDVILEDIKYFVKETDLSVCGDTTDCRGIELQNAIKNKQRSV